MFKKYLVPALGLIGSATVALAASSAKLPDPAVNEIACFQRTYTPEHLQAHPGQTPADMTIALYREANESHEFESKYVFVSVGIHRAADVLAGKKARFFWNSGLCHLVDAHYQCGFECDGGQFQLRVNSLGDLMVKNDFMALIGCGEDEAQGEPQSVDLNSHNQPEDALFKVPAAAIDSCLEAFPSLKNLGRQILPVQIQ